MYYPYLFNHKDKNYVIVSEQTSYIDDMVGMNEIDIVVYKVYEVSSSGAWKPITNKKFISPEKCKEYIKENV